MQPDLVSQVEFEFLDMGGHENLEVNGNNYVGELSQIGGANLAVSTTPIPHPNRPSQIVGYSGTVTLTGNLQTLFIGGQEFWIDNVCVRN